MPNDLDPSEDPKNIEKYWIRTMYVDPPDRVFCEETGFPASMGGMSDPANVPDPVAFEAPYPDWRQEFKEWFDKQP